MSSALHLAEMEARVQVAKADAGARAAQVEAESARSELSIKALMVRGVGMMTSAPLCRLRVPYTSPFNCSVVVMKTN